VREKYCWLVADGCFVLREKFRWLVADKPKGGAASQGRPGELPRRAPDKRGLATSSAVWRLERRCGPEASSPAGGGVGVGFGLPRRRRQRYRFGFLPFLKKSFFLIFFFRIFCERLIGNHPNGAAWRPQG
jgi:hypothetical protein